MTSEEAKALYAAGKIKAIAYELRQELKALDWQALESYMEHPAPDFAYKDTCYFVMKLARDLQAAPEIELGELLSRYGGIFE